MLEHAIEVGSGGCCLRLTPEQTEANRHVVEVSTPPQAPIVYSLLVLFLESSKTLHRPMKVLSYQFTLLRQTEAPNKNGKIINPDRSGLLPLNFEQLAQFCVFSP